MVVICLQSSHLEICFRELCRRWFYGPLNLFPHGPGKQPQEKSLVGVGIFSVLLPNCQCHPFNIFPGCLRGPHSKRTLMAYLMSQRLHERCVHWDIIMALLHMNIYVCIYIFNSKTLKVINNSSIITILVGISHLEGQFKFLFTFKLTKFGCGCESLENFQTLS